MKLDITKFPNYENFVRAIEELPTIELREEIVIDAPERFVTLVTDTKKYKFRATIYNELGGTIRFVLHGKPITETQTPPE